MPQARSISHRLLGPAPAKLGGGQWWSSAETEDHGWDAFLLQSPQGQFQQSGAWSRYKAHDGWAVERVLVADDDTVAGGFQLLWRRSRLGRIGYVSKGPVLRDESPATSKAMVQQLRDTARRLGLRAVIAQPPDDSRHLASALDDAGFLPNRLREVIRTTLVIDLSAGIAAVERGMSSTARTEVRQAQRRGTIVRDGNHEDIGACFAMIAKTCERQNTQPNPSSETDLRQLWEAVQPLGARLLMARCRDEDVAVQLCIPFGRRATIWKKGWNGRHADGHPNRLLNYEGLKWACHLGCSTWDYVAVNDAIGDQLLAGQPLTAEQKRSRDMFHLTFGGVPRRLPDSRIWISHPILRVAYRLYARSARR